MSVTVALFHFGLFCIPLLLLLPMVQTNLSPLEPFFPLRSITTPSAAEYGSTAGRCQRALEQSTEGMTKTMGLACEEEAYPDETFQLTTVDAACNWTIPVLHIRVRQTRLSARYQRQSSLVHVAKIRISKR